MRTKARVRSLLWVGMVLLLLMAPLSAAQGQDVTGGDATGQEGGDEFGEVVESDGVADQGESEAASQEGMLAPDAAVQPHRLYLPAIQGGDAAAEQVEAAFMRSWSLVSCTNVLNNSTNRGLWDDMPGPGINNEAGLLWFVTNEDLEEQCTYQSTIGFPGVPATQLRFRVAVNDNAIFQVGLYRWVGTVCRPYLAFITSPASDDSSFRLSPLHAFSPAPICAVRIMLTDDPNTITFDTSRTSALIDYIRLYNNGVQVWQESFSNSIPVP